jgi:GNAT superfamily N-acetyltransferase
MRTEHDRSGFSCGSPALDQYLKTQASQDLRRQLAAVFVLTEAGSPAVIGYYCLSSASIQHKDVPAELARRLPYSSLPATLLGRLAVDSRRRGERLGEFLLMDALDRAVAAAGTIGAWAVVVDAKDEAAAGFYEHYGFHRFLDDPLRLFLPLKTVAKLLGGA